MDKSIDKISKTYARLETNAKMLRRHSRMNLGSFAQSNYSEDKSVHINIFVINRKLTTYYMLLVPPMIRCYHVILNQN